MQVQMQKCILSLRVLMVMQRKLNCQNLVLFRFNKAGKVVFLSYSIQVLVNYYLCEE